MNGLLLAVVPGGPLRMERLRFFVRARAVCARLPLLPPTAPEMKPPARSVSIPHHITEHPTPHHTTPHHHPTQPTPVFGSGTAFGSGGGFGAFTGVTGSSAPAADAAAAADGGDAGADGGDDDPEAECTAEFKPVVQLDEVETSTGEEDEECLLDLKCKLYRFDAGGNEWKERGIGQARLLKHKANARTRLLVRQEKTLKIRANHIVMPGTKLQEHAGSDKAWVFSTVDFSEGEQRVELFCIRFGSVESESARWSFFGGGEGR